MIENVDDELFVIGCGCYFLEAMAVWCMIRDGVVVLDVYSWFLWVILHYYDRSVLAYWTNDVWMSVELGNIKYGMLSDVYVIWCYCCLIIIAYSFA